ncbi:MAG TPA: hypothetical protein VMF86_12985 [Stellaceae bacterium]|nr:hypothetical protein [Stellaceae bacterium]
MATRREVASWIAALALLPAAIGWSHGAAAQPLPAPRMPPGRARVWFVRLYEPYVSLATPMMFVNGSPLGASVPGTVFYRDFPPGTYTFSVASYGIDYGQAPTVPLRPGEELYFIVWCDTFWASGRFFQRDTFYVLPIPPPTAWQYMRLPEMRDLGAR